MKKILHTIVLLSLLGLSNSCENFLDAPYDNRVEITELEDVNMLLANAYPMRADVFTEIMTDNFHHYATTMQASNGATYIPIYNWEDEYSDAIATATPTHAYSHYYRKIYEANLAIEQLNLSTAGEPVWKDALMGEALVLRAYSYFSLVNLFSLHYNEERNATNLGVPLILEVPKENRELYNRATVKDVYDQIELDVQEGLSLLQRGGTYIPNTPYRFSLASVYAFLSRINLYKENWDETVRYADLVVQDRGLVVRDMSEDVARRLSATEAFWAQEIMNPSIHLNLLLVNQTNEFLCRPFGYRLGGFYLAHNVFYTTPAQDYRTHQFSSGGTVIDSVALVVKYANQPNNPNAAQARYDCFTMEEVLLNRAEANLKKSSPDIERAMADIEVIRRQRFAIANYAPLSVPASVADAITAVLSERKLELIGQGYRWYDIKRLGIEIEHRLVRTDPRTANILLPNDLRTAIQIPIQARLGNPLLENQLNPR